ncbi:uncharacterized protein LOC125775576 [Bactrocera dorsalis]|uniref:Regulatory protein zeste n=1 Tax=Bactrocera dorsalis TaxID=27457 RepID=A0ABM3IYW9_BACDO|nr:uncharacterized protein LOC125775576 [Bactrocera dorsalis]
MELFEFKANRSTSGRATNGQKRRLLHLMQQHRSVGRGQYTKPNARKEHEEVWAAVAAELNALGGSHKSPNQWKKCWIDWKSAVKKLHNAHRAFARRTGNLPLQDGPKPLDAMDREILGFFSSDMVDGDGLTPEIGLSTTAEMVDVTIEDEGDATANIGLDVSNILQN